MSQDRTQAYVDGSAATPVVGVTAPPSIDAVQQAISPLMYVRPWGR